MRRAKSFSSSRAQSAEERADCGWVKRRHRGVDHQPGSDDLLKSDPSEVPPGLIVATRRVDVRAGVNVWLYAVLSMPGPAAGGSPPRYNEGTIDTYRDGDRLQ